MPISKHLANETGTVYRLLRQNIPRPQLELQHQLVRAAKLQQGPGPILGVVQNHVQDFHAVNSGTALHLLVQSTQEYRSNDGTTMSQMLQAVRAECPRLLNRILVDVEKKPRDLATAAWSLAHLAVSHEETLAKLAREVEKAAGHFEGQDVANTMWAFTKLYVRHSRPLLGTLANVAMTHLKDYEPRHLVGAAWALANSRVLHEDYFWIAARIAQETRAKHWGPQDISNFLWAYATLRCEAPPPLESLVSRAAALGWHKFLPRELSITMWAVMTLGIRDSRPSVHSCVQRLLQHTARHLRDVRPQDFEPQHFTNAAWALSRWQRHCRLFGWPQECKAATCRPALRSLANAAANRTAEFKSAELARFLWALGSQACLHLRVIGPGLVKDLQQPGRLAQFTAEDVCTVVTVLSWMVERAVLEPPSSRHM